MQLSDQQIIQFQALYATKIGRDITRAEALEMGTKLVRMMQLVYKPITPEQYEEVQEKQKELL